MVLCKILDEYLTFVDADTYADTGGSTIALCECCSGELKIGFQAMVPKFPRVLYIHSYSITIINHFM